MTALFSWIPDWSFTGTHEPRVFNLTYGDGYAQRTANGLNADLRTWDLTFSVRTQAVALAIEAFLKAQAGVTAFNFQVPGADLALVICQKYSIPRQDGPNSYAMTATFKEVVA